MARTMLITGASRGIGAATAILAGARGYRVAVNYRHRAERAEQVVERIGAAGGEAIAVAGNVGSDDDVDRIFAQVDAAFGPLDVLVNAAGITGVTGHFTDLDLGETAEIMAVNVTGTILCCDRAARRMSLAAGGRGGVIVNVSSTAARLGGPGLSVVYAASKGAIDSFTVGLARELGSQGIRVNAVRPGVIDTEIHPEGRVESISASLPMKRAGTAEEVAAAIVWLAGQEASYVSGAILDVSGAR